MNRLKLIGHKWYVFFITLKSLLGYISEATERIAGLKIVILTEKDLDDLDEHLAQEDHEEEVDINVNSKDLN